MSAHPNAIRIVSCDTCATEIRRRPINPNTRKPIKRFFCGLPCKAEWQRGLRPIEKDELHRLYMVEKLSANEIAERVKRNPKRVWEWLKDDGIETRPRGHDERQHFKPGHKICVGRKHSEKAKNAIRRARIADGSKGLFLPNGDHVLKGRTGPDHPSWKGGATPERQAFYATDEWKSACVSVWKRADAHCERCGKDHRTIDRTETHFCVHHVASFAEFPELRAEPDNLTLLCLPCHLWVHSRKNTEKEFIREA